MTKFLFSHDNIDIIYHLANFKINFQNMICLLPI